MLDLIFLQAAEGAAQIQTVMRNIRKYIIPIVTLLVGFASFSGLLGFLNTEMLTGWIKTGVGGDMGTICSCFVQMLYVILLVPCAIKFIEGGTVGNSGQAPDMQ